MPAYTVYNAIPFFEDRAGKNVPKPPAQVLGSGSGESNGHFKRRINNDGKETK